MGHEIFLLFVNLNLKRITARNRMVLTQVKKALVFHGLMKSLKKKFQHYMFTFQDELDNNNMVRESLHVFHRSEKSRVLSKKKKVAFTAAKAKQFSVVSPLGRSTTNNSTTTGFY